MRTDIDTYQQAVVYLYRDCGVCRAEGFTALMRVCVRSEGRQVVATLNVVDDGDRFRVDEAAFSQAAWQTLQPRPTPSASSDMPTPRPPNPHCVPRSSEIVSRNPNSCA